MSKEKAEKVEAPVVEAEVLLQKQEEKPSTKKIGKGTIIAVAAATAIVSGFGGFLGGLALGKISSSKQANSCGGQFQQTNQAPTQMPQRPSGELPQNQDSTTENSQNSQQNNSSSQSSSQQKTRLTRESSQTTQNSQNTQNSTSSN